MDDRGRSFAVDEETETEAVPEGKIKCYITGNLREDTPEEREYAKPLLEVSLMSMGMKNRT